MDEFYNEFETEADSMFSELYGDMTYNEPPVIDVDIESMDEEQYIGSIELPSSASSEPVTEPENEYDELILDKEENKQETPENESEMVSDKELDAGLDDKSDDEEIDMSDILSDDNLKEVNYSTEEPKGVEFPDETVEVYTPTEQKIDEEPEVVVEKAPEPSMVYENRSEIINEEPYEEPVLEETKEKVKLSSYVYRFRKGIALAVMIFVIIGIPLLFSYVARDTDNSRDSKVARTDNSTKSTVSTELGLTGSSDYDDIRQSAYDSMSETNTSNRFKTLDELTFYLQSNIDSTLSYEKALANQYENGAVSSDYFYSELAVYIEYTDNLNHLLTINKTTYENEGKMSDYNSLSESMDTLILYGDNLNYGTRNTSE